MAKHFTYLPLVMKNYDPLLYDDFNDVTWDGAWNPAKWHAWDTTGFNVRQENGAMVFSEPITYRAKPRPLDLQRWGEHSLGQLHLFEARLKISSDRSGGGSAVWIHFGGKVVGYDDWYTECGLEGQTGGHRIRSLSDRSESRRNGTMSIETPDIRSTMTPGIRCVSKPILRLLTCDSSWIITLLGSHTPKDAAALRQRTILSLQDLPP